METWILLHVPTAVLFVAIVAISVGLSIGGVFIVRRSVEASVLEPHHDVAGFILAVVGVVYAVLLAFVVVIVWQQFDEARADADREAAVLLAVSHDGVVLGDVGPDPRQALHDYADAIVRSEWPQMSRFHRESREADEALDRVWAAFRSVKPRTASDSAFYEQAISGLHTASESRRKRIATSGTGIPATLWIVLIVGAVISIAFTYLFGVKNLRVQILLVASLASLVGLVLALVLSLDLPFTGGMAVDPGAMENAVTEFSHDTP
jgi:tryptophan-rich sensory protein